MPLHNKGLIYKSKKHHLIQLLWHKTQKMSRPRAKNRPHQKQIRNPGCSHIGLEKRKQKSWKKLYLLLKQAVGVLKDTIAFVSFKNNSTSLSPQTILVKLKNAKKKSKYTVLSV